MAVRAKSPAGVALPQVPQGAASPHSKKAQQNNPSRRLQPLPNYKLLTQPRTNNYYAATGGCPCIPRAAAHPGSWRLRAVQLRSTTVPRGAHKNCGAAAAAASCCVPRGDMYGWRPGPHRVLARNTAASGLCDTFGNMAFKRPKKAGDGESEASHVDKQELEDLEELILEEHRARREVELDVEELKEIQRNGTQGAYKLDFENEKNRELAAAATEDQLNALLNEVRGIVKRPLNQTNMGILRRVVEKQEKLMELRRLKANETYPQIIYP